MELYYRHLIIVGGLFKMPGDTWHFFRKPIFRIVFIATINAIIDFRVRNYYSNS
jgi:hypothetical protein